MANELIKNIYLELKEFIISEIIPQIDSNLDKRTHYLEGQYNKYEKWKNETSSLEESEKIFLNTAEYHKTLVASADEEKLKIIKNNTYNLIELYQNKYDALTKNVDVELIINQEDSHFNPAKDDSFSQKKYKKIKNLSFSVLRYFKRIIKGKDYKYHWKRKIPFKCLFEKYFLINYKNKLVTILEEYYELNGLLYINILNAQKDIDKHFIDKHFEFIKDTEKKEFEESLLEFEKIYSEQKQNFIENKNLLSEKIISSLEKELQSFIATYNVIGTIGNSGSDFSEKAIQSQKEREIINFEQSQKHFSIFFDAVFDRIEYYRDLLWFTNLVLSNSFNSTKKAEDYKTNVINPIILSIIKEVSISKEKIENEDGDFKSVVKSEKRKLINSLDQKLVVDLLNKITNSKANLFLDEYEIKIAVKLNEFDKNFRFIKPASLKFKIDNNQLKEFSPKEILVPIIIKKLGKVIERIKIEFKNKNSKLNPNVINLARIVEFNLDSALSKYSDDKKSILEAKEIAINGLDRFINKVEDIYEELGTMHEYIREELNAELKEQLENLFGLSNIERLISVKLQVSKEKAIQESKERFQVYVEKGIFYAKLAYKKTEIIFNSLKGKILGISTKVGLSSADIELSEAMVDYLARVSTSIEKLPYVYKRLFSDEELTDSRMFVGRKKELAKFEKAYKYWQNKQISSVMMIGEKGSGTSSLINIFINKLNPPNKIFRKKFIGTIYKEDDLIKYLKDLLSLKKINNNDELIEAIQNFEERRIVIVENFEDFFLRFVDGFDSAKKMFEIITLTSNKIFWIITCNTFAWNYLNRVMQIKDYFVFNIHFNELEKNSFEELIMLRHNISGYNITFLPSDIIEKQKFYKKLDEKGKQEYLKKEYFERLYKIASNNVGIALFLWLRSIKDADEEEILISTDIELDFSFLNELSDQKLFSIMALILHDGLSIEEHSIIFNVSQKDSQLLLAALLDDGIIFKRDNVFKVNFQLYKPLVNLLRSKNIIH